MTCSNCKTKEATAVKEVKNVYYVLCDDCVAALTVNPKKEESDATNNRS